MGRAIDVGTIGSSDAIGEVLTDRGWSCERHSTLAHLVHPVDPLSIAHRNERRFGRGDFGLQLFDLRPKGSDLFFLAHHIHPNCCLILLT
jgi:hypothetical protein